MSSFRLLISCLTVVVITGCAALGGGLETGPEFNQKVLLLVDDNYQMFQAPQSDYDVGDLQSFHSQHTFPYLVQGAFEEMFSQVQMVEGQAGIEAGAPDVPAVFEVHMIDLAHDIYMEADSYRAQTVIAAAMKTPDGKILWQEAFRGNGYVVVDPQFSTGLGPQDAVTDAVYDALGQMQKAIVNSPVVSRQLRFYRTAEEAEREREVSVDLARQDREVRI